jgi:hypothetical protein
MREWRALSLEESLRHPRPGSRIEAAQRYGIDLTLLIENLRLSPAERVREMHDAMVAAEQVRGAARSIVAHALLRAASPLMARPSSILGISVRG